ncbi:tryptophan synthase beta subunit-like PLP-dependent enzyme [Paraphoma chrysanthemicola]|nr:tryptophan synthase beta subunit-like PLP-dependent enzyme [Paraphoma chrysanthemicola]
MVAFAVNLPRPFADIPRAALLFQQATPIEPLRNLTKHLEQGANAPQSVPAIWIKHEDANSALAHGGNKVRKLEYVLADALAKRVTHLVTVGGVQSNSQRQVAAAGNRFGLQTVLTPDPKFGDPSSQDRVAYDTVENVQISGILGADWKPSTEYDTEEAEREMERLSADGGTPYFIPTGVSLHELGGLGFARWVYEVVEQEKEIGITFDVIIVSAASGSTLGATSCEVKQTSGLVLKSAQNTAKLVGLNEKDVVENDFEIDGRFNGGAYGHLNDETRDAIKLLAQAEGILTDPVYTGKAMAGLLGLAREGALGSAQNVLFVHTGGTQALSGYPSLH